MWTCSDCGRIFEKVKQPHSCQRVPVEEHFKHKEKAKELFSYLHTTIEKDIGTCQIISLPCCVHLFGLYDFLAALPKKETLEVRFTLNRKLSNTKACVPISAQAYKNCFDISSKEEFDDEFMSWLKESYFLKTPSFK
jgi:hypothetical protein